MVKCYPAQPFPFPTNHFTPRSEQHYFNSPYNFRHVQYNFRQVIRIKKKINKGIVFCYDTKLSGKANKDMNINYLGELL